MSGFHHIYFRATTLADSGMSLNKPTLSRHVLRVPSHACSGTCHDTCHPSTSLHLASPPRNAQPDNQPQVTPQANVSLLILAIYLVPL